MVNFEQVNTVWYKIITIDTAKQLIQQFLRNKHISINWISVYSLKKIGCEQFKWYSENEGKSFLDNF